MLYALIHDGVSQVQYLGESPLQGLAWYSHGLKHVLLNKLNVFTTLEEAKTALIAVYLKKIENVTRSS